MKILITTDLFTTSTNGVVTSVKNLIKELTDKGHDVRVLTLSEGIYSYEEGMVYYIRSIPVGVYPNVRMPISYRHTLIKELIDWKPEIIHSQCEFFTFQYAMRISRLTGAPIVHTFHTMYEQYVTYVISHERIGNRIVQIFTRKRLKHVNTVIAPTAKVEETLLGYKIKKEICVVPSGINLDQHHKRISAAQRSEKRRILGIPENGTVLISLGRLGMEKNIDELLYFFSDAVKQKKDLYLLIVGDGPARDQLEQLTQSLGIADFVRFTGMVKPEEVQEYYQLGDVFVSASTSETQGLTYIEAAANGLPLLCRQDVCLKDVILQGENGFAYTSEEEFLEGIHLFADNPECLAAAGKRSEEIAESFDRKNFGTTVEGIYRSVLN